MVNLLKLDEIEIDSESKSEHESEPKASASTDSKTSKSKTNSKSKTQKAETSWSEWWKEHWLHGLQILCFFLRISSIISVIYSNYPHSAHHELIMSTCRIAIASSSFFAVFFLTKKKPSFSVKYFEQYCKMYFKNSIDLQIYTLVHKTCEINKGLKWDKIRKKKNTLHPTMCRIPLLFLSNKN